jgi:hypothetical protein
MRASTPYIPFSYGWNEKFSFSLFAKTFAFRNKKIAKIIKILA